MRRTFSIVAMVLAMTWTASGQPSQGDPNQGQKPGSPAPISGIEILIGLGGLLGAKKVYDARKKGKGEG